MKQKIEFLTDIDGVCVDWLGGYIDYMASIGYQAEHNDPEHFSMIDIFPELEKPYQFINDFHNSDFYVNLKPFPEAVEACNVLNQMGIDIIAITSCGRDGAIKQARINNLKNNFGNVFSEIHALDITEDKYDVLKQYSPTLFIDDQKKNVSSAIKAGHLGCLLDKSYNRDKNSVNHNNIKKNNQNTIEPFERVKNWNQVVNHFKTILAPTPKRTRAKFAKFK